MQWKYDQVPYSFSISILHPTFLTNTQRGIDIDYVVEINHEDAVAAATVTNQIRYGEFVKPRSA